jgi:transcription elongation GreA/GreB family factor
MTKSFDEIYQEELDYVNKRNINEVVALIAAKSRIDSRNYKSDAENYKYAINRLLERITKLENDVANLKSFTNVTRSNNVKIT